MVGMLDELMLRFQQQRGGGFGPPPIPGLSPAELAMASQPAMIGDRPMGIGGMNPQNQFPFGTGAPPIVGLMNGGQQQSPMPLGEPAVTSLNGGGAIPLPRPRPSGADEISSRGVATQAPGAPLSLAPPAPMAAAPGGGAPMGGGFNALTSRLPPASLLAAMAGGFAGAPSFGSGMRRAFSAAAPVMAQQEQLDRQLGVQQQTQADTYRALIAAGVPREQALAGIRNPVILKELADRYMGAAKTTAPSTTEFKDTEGNTRKEQWNPTTQRWEPIPGHDKWTKRDTREIDKVDANVAARLGLAESFITQLPAIRERISKGEATGPIDAVMGQFGVGAPGELRRQVASGAEALLRNLTGAGMNKDEAARYVKRYEIEATDTVGSVTSKLNQLERELSYTLRAVYRGRGGIPKVLEGKLHFDEDAGGMKLPSGRTRGGIAWSVVPDGAD